MANIGLQTLESQDLQFKTKIFPGDRLVACFFHPSGKIILAYTDEPNLFTRILKSRDFFPML